MLKPDECDMIGDPTTEGLHYKKMINGKAHKRRKADHCTMCNAHHVRHVWHQRECILHRDKASEEFIGRPVTKGLQGMVSGIRAWNGKSSRCYLPSAWPGCKDTSLHVESGRGRAHRDIDKEHGSGTEYGIRAWNGISTIRLCLQGHLQQHFSVHADTRCALSSPYFICKDENSC